AVRTIVGRAARLAGAVAADAGPGERAGAVVGGAVGVGEAVVAEAGAVLRRAADVHVGVGDEARAVREDADGAAREAAVEDGFGDGERPGAGRRAAVAVAQDVDGSLVGGRRDRGDLRRLVAARRGRGRQGPEERRAWSPGRVLRVACRSL